MPKHTMTKKDISAHFKMQLGIEEKTAFRSGHKILKKTWCELAQWNKHK